MLINILSAYLSEEKPVIKEKEPINTIYETDNTNIFLKYNLSWIFNENLFK